MAPSLRQINQDMEAQIMGQFTNGVTHKRAWRKILCKRYSTKSRMAQGKRGGIWLNPLLTDLPAGGAVCAPQA